MGDGSENRRSLRIVISHQVKIKLSSGLVVCCMGKNLSQTGVYMESDAIADMNAQFDMQLMLSFLGKPYMVVCRAKVVRVVTRSVGYGLALDFIKFYGDGENNLDDYIKCRGGSN